MAVLTSSKAKKMLTEGTARGNPLTSRQKRFFGWVAGGRKKPKGVKRARKIFRSR